MLEKYFKRLYRQYRRKTELNVKMFNFLVSCETINARNI